MMLGPSADGEVVQNLNANVVVENTAKSELGLCLLSEFFFFFSVLISHLPTFFSCGVCICVFFIGYDVYARVLMCLRVYMVVLRSFC